MWCMKCADLMKQLRDMNIYIENQYGMGPLNLQYATTWK